MSTDTYIRSQAGVRRLVSGLFAGAWQLEVLVLLATLAVGFGIGILLSSFLLGFLTVLVAALLVLLIFSVLGSPPSSSDRQDEAPQLQHEPDHHHVHS